MRLSADRHQIAETPPTLREPLQRRAVVVGLVGALIFIAGVTAYLAMIEAPYQPDEASHVGYALSLRQGDLPSVTAPVPTEGGGEHLRIALSRPWPFSNANINVANNPPFVYLASLPLVEGAIRTHIMDGPLLVLRLVDLIGAVAAVGVAYLLGCELSGGDRFVGVVTSGLLSGVIAISVISSLAAIDGPALVATTGVAWMIARFARTRALRDATALGIWCAAAAAVRPMSFVFALVAGVMALFLGLRARGIAACAPLVLRLASPTLLITGWFYAWNLYRFGNVAGPYTQTEDGGLGSTRSVFDLLTGPDVSVKPFAYLVTEVYGRSPWWWEYQGVRHYLITAIGVSVVVTAIILAARSSTSVRWRRNGAELSLAAWISVAVLALVPIVLTAYHASGGGAGHARYLLPTLPIVAAATALVGSWINRWLAVAVVGAFAIAEITRIRAAGNLRDGALSITPPQLRQAPVGQPFLALSVAVAIAGAGMLVASLVRLAKKSATAEHRRLS